MHRPLIAVVSGVLALFAAVATVLAQQQIEGTVPIYVSIVVLPLTSGFAGAALVTFASFAAAMAFMMLFTSLLVGLAKASLLRRLQASAVWIKRASGAVLILAGIYLGYYYVRAGM